MGTFAETAIVDYRLPTKENNFLFPFSVCPPPPTSKQTEVCRFRF
jgi:hypothetical protein